MPNKKVDDTAKITETTMQIVKLLNRLDSADRQKVIQASLTLLGEGSPSFSTDVKKEEHAGQKDTASVAGMPPKASAWVRQNGLTIAQIEQVFDIEGDPVTLIAGAIPGRTPKHQTIAAYVLQGITQLLATGDPTFDDKSARKLCQDLGCYDSTNHAKYVEALGNNITGSKDKGWKLTAPGMKKGANLVEEITKEP